MPRLRDISYRRVIKLLKKIGYVKDRQSSSHIIMKASGFESKSDFDEITVVADNPLSIGTLSAILKDASEQTGIDIKRLKRMLEEI
ncbi:MAG TPA: type II toxin-antitoxin system HicA family toxin [Methanocella sp.]